MNRSNIRRVSHGYHYFFVKPGRKTDVHTAATRLMGIREIREVAVTEGDYGFVVKAHNVDEGEKAVVREIARAVGGSSRRAVCHCRYVRN